jgi:microcystin-dependent protein
MEAYLGSIFAFGFNYPPVGWALCNGQTLSISGNEPLFTLLGNTYGGDGVSNFALPDLQGRVPIGTGQGAGLQNYVLGQSGGATGTVLTTANIPPHTHTIGAVTIPVGGNADQTDPTGMYFGIETSGSVYETTTNAIMAVSSSASSPALDPVNGTMLNMPNTPLTEVMAPYLVVNYCICVSGLFPPHP